MPNTRASIESPRASPSRITSIPLGRVSVLPEDEINDDDPAETQVHKEALDPDDEDEDEDEYDSTLPEGEDDRGRGDILSKITEDDQKEMLEQNRMPLELLFEQQAECKEERTRMLTELDRGWTINRTENPGNQSKICRMVDPLRYCGGAKEMDKFLVILRSNFASHKHRFPTGDPDQVKYAVSFPDTWNNHPDTTQRQTKNMDPSEWASHLRQAKDPCLQNFELFANELQKMYRNKDRHLNSATQAMQKYQQLPNKSVRIHANRLKADRRRACWSLITHEVVLYDMAWAGLRHALNTNVRPWIPGSEDRFDTLDQLFDCAVASQFKPDDKKPRGQQQQQWQVGESQTGGDMKRNFRPSISDLAENTSGNSNNPGTGNSKSGKFNKSSGGSRPNLSPAPWLSKEAYECRKANRQFTCCGSGDHNTYLCTKYGKTNPPDRNSSNSSGYDGKQIKRQKSFNTQRQENYSTSLDI